MEGDGALALLWPLRHDAQNGDHYEERVPGPLEVTSPPAQHRSRSEEETMIQEERVRMVNCLEEAVMLLVERMDARLVPDGGMQIVYALSDARSKDDVAGVAGRIARFGDEIRPTGEIAFGAGEDVTRFVLTAMRFDPDIRSAANVRFSETVLMEMENLLFEVCSFDRAKEPPGVQTMDWGVASCCKEGVPDVIYDRGAMGVEPMFRVFGEDPVRVAHNLIKLSNRIPYAQL
jgi:hydroxymethylpyrimidine/phosphomethylpyrimidine kinase